MRSGTPLGSSQAGGQLARRSLSTAALSIAGAPPTLDLSVRGSTSPGSYKRPSNGKLSSTAGFVRVTVSAASLSSPKLGAGKSQLQQQRKLVPMDDFATMFAPPQESPGAAGFSSVDSVFGLEVTVNKALTGQRLAHLVDCQTSLTIAQVIERLIRECPLSPGQRYKLTYGGANLDLDSKLDAIVRKAVAHKLELQAVIKDKRPVDSPAAFQALQDIASLPAHYPEECRALVSPPWAMLRIVELVSIILDIKPDRVRDPDSKKLLDNYWPPARRSWLTLAPAELVKTLADIDLEDFNAPRLGKIQQYLESEDTLPDYVESTSLFMSKLAVWCHAFGNYVRSTS